MKPHQAQSQFIAKLISSCEQALSHGSPRHSVVTESKEALDGVRDFFVKHGWETEFLETKAKPGDPDYLGVLIIRRPKVKAT